MVKKRKIPKWSRTLDFVFKQKEPNKIMSIFQIDKALWINIHLDFNLYDFKQNIMWKGDLV